MKIDPTEPRGRTVEVEVETMPDEVWVLRVWDADECVEQGILAWPRKPTDREVRWALASFVDGEFLFDGTQWIHGLESHVATLESVDVENNR